MGAARKSVLVMRKGLGPEGAEESGLPQEAGSRFGLLGRAVAGVGETGPPLPHPVQAFSASFPHQSLFCLPGSSSFPGYSPPCVP